jgi:hypothetical protein
MEYWVVFDLATGEERWRGAGSVGMAAQQEVPDGLGVAVVPAAAVRTASIDLDVIRSASASQIDATAEVVRMGFLTPGAGQAMTYQRKEAEARAWTADNGAFTPFLSAEAPARGMTVAALAAEVIRLADAWTTIGSAIEAMRMKAKADIAQATNLGEIIAASRVDWSGLHV